MCAIASTFLVSPSGDDAGPSGGHHNPRLGQTDGADLLRHIDRLSQMHQGDVIGDVAFILLVDKALVLNDTVHHVALLRWGNIHGGVHVVLPETHAPLGGYIQWPGAKVKEKIRTCLTFLLSAAVQKWMTISVSPGCSFNPSITIFCQLGAAETSPNTSPFMLLNC